MSHEATNWAFEQPQVFPDMKPPEWAVLIVLADCHNPLHGCFPSQEYIAARAGSDFVIKAPVCEVMLFCGSTSWPAFMECVEALDSLGDFSFKLKGQGAGSDVSNSLLECTFPAQAGRVI